jgi:SHS2 domain-containing protein
MTDAEIESYGRDLNEAFQNAGLATEDTMVELSSIRPAKEKHVKVDGRDLESLLYSWLESLIAMQDTSGLLFSKISCKVTKTTKGFKMDCTCVGEKFDPERHEQKTAIKAPTYHDMKIIQQKSGVSMRFLLDL